MNSLSSQTTRDHHKNSTSPETLKQGYPSNQTSTPAQLSAKEREREEEERIRMRVEGANCLWQNSLWQENTDKPTVIIQTEYPLLTPRIRSRGKGPRLLVPLTSEMWGRERSLISPTSNLAHSTLSFLSSLGPDTAWRQCTTLFISPTCGWLGILILMNIVEAHPAAINSYLRDIVLKEVKHILYSTLITVKREW